MNPPHEALQDSLAPRTTLGGGSHPVELPRRPPASKWRPTQSNIPGERAQRDLLRAAAAEIVGERDLVPPVSLPELRELALVACRRAGLAPLFADFATVLVNNEVWRDELARVPYDRRLLLLPKCLRAEGRCPAPFDAFGMLCKQCGLCSIDDLAQEAEELGYAVLLAEGSALVTAMVESGRIEAIVGVSCMNVLERCFPHLEAAAIPGMSVPLLQDDCSETNVDVDQVRDLIHLTARDRTYRLDLEALKGEVRSWFTPQALEEILGPTAGIDPRTDEIARDWLARAGKRWRPFLLVALWIALEAKDQSDPPGRPRDLRRLAVAIECFHKASLVHDDIEDGDLTRYGEATLHASHGVDVALNIGDLLLGEGYRLLAEMDAAPDVRAELMRVAARGHVALSRGQGAELNWTHAPRPLSALEVLSIFREKTAPAFEVALRMGATYAGAGREVLDVLGPYSEALGIAYQIQDDLDDHDGENGDSDDLAALRPSLILAMAHKHAREGAERRLLDALWRRERGPAEEREELDRILAERGVLTKARELAEAYERKAIETLRGLPHASAKGLLRRVIGKIFGEGDLLPGYCSEFEARNAPGRAAGADAPG